MPVSGRSPASKPDCVTPVPDPSGEGRTDALHWFLSSESESWPIVGSYSFAGCLTRCADRHLGLQTSPSLACRNPTSPFVCLNGGPPRGGTRLRHLLLYHIVALAGGIARYRERILFTRASSRCDSRSLMASRLS